MKKNKPIKAASKKKITSKELDDKFDAGVFRVNVDFPAWTVSGLDKEATRLGISRQALIKVWIAERLDQASELKKIET